MNKSIAGYQILPILLGVDVHIDKEEQKVILAYIKSEFKIPNNLEVKALKFIEINPSDYSSLFYESMDMFYLNSNQTERNSFLAFVLKLVKKPTLKYQLLKIAI